jgi:hypothetical protein
MPRHVFQMVYGGGEVFFHQILYQGYIAAPIGGHYSGMLGNGYVAGIHLGGVIRELKWVYEPKQLRFFTGRFELI